MVQHNHCTPVGARREAIRPPAFTQFCARCKMRHDLATGPARYPEHGEDYDTWVSGGEEVLTQLTLGGAREQQLRGLSAGRQQLQAARQALPKRHSSTRIDRRAIGWGPGSGWENVIGQSLADAGAGREGRGPARGGESNSVTRMQMSSSGGGAGAGLDSTALPAHSSGAAAG